MAKNAMVAYSVVGGTLSAEPGNINDNADKFKGRLSGIAVAQRTISESIIFWVVESMVRDWNVAAVDDWSPDWCGRSLVERRRKSKVLCLSKTLCPRYTTLESFWISSSSDERWRQMKVQLTDSSSQSSMCEPSIEWPRCSTDVEYKLLRMICGSSFWLDPLLANDDVRWLAAEPTNELRASP